MLRPHPKPPWSPEERAWGLECLAARDSPQEIAEWAGRTAMDVLTEFKLAGHLEPEQRWRRSVRGDRGSHMVGRMLKTAADERHRGGATMDALAAEAGVTYWTMQAALKAFRQAEKKRLEAA